jgi:hypothetical protein
MPILGFTRKPDNGAFKTKETPDLPVIRQLAAISA